MRRIASTLSVFAAAGMLALAVPGSAYAAEGTLVIGKIENQNPSGCFEVPSGSAVKNNTDTPVVVHSAPGCEGEVAFVLAPGDDAPPYSEDFSVSVA